MKNYRLRSPKVVPVDVEGDAEDDVVRELVKDGLGSGIDVPARGLGHLFAQSLFQVDKLFAVDSQLAGGAGGRHGLGLDAVFGDFFRLLAILRQFAISMRLRS